MCSAQVGATSLGCDSSATKLLGQDSPWTTTPSRVPRTAPEPTTAPRRQVARLTPRARRVRGRPSPPSEPREGEVHCDGPHRRPVGASDAVRASGAGGAARGAVASSGTQPHAPPPDSAPLARARRHQWRVPAPADDRAHRLPVPYPHQTARAPQLNDAAPDTWIELSVKDAAGIGVGEGDVVRVESRRGALEGRARITGVRPGVVFVSFHYGDWGTSTPASARMRVRAATVEPRTSSRPRHGIPCRNSPSA